jgi:hypothetical protein
VTDEPSPGLLVDDTLDLGLDVAAPARVYDYLLGGRTHFTADREFVGHLAAAFPGVFRAAHANRAFARRATGYLAARGLRQFLEVGAGIPHAPNLHDIARAAGPDARVVYVDHDPVVITYVHALLCTGSRGQIACLQADLTDPDAILRSPVVRTTLDLARPVALGLTGILHGLSDDQRARQIVATLTGALAPGSALMLSHPTGDLDAGALTAAAEVYRAAGISVRLRTRAQVEQFFDGWDLVAPGVCRTGCWARERPRWPGGAWRGWVPSFRRCRCSDDGAAAYAGVAFKTAKAPDRGARGRLWPPSRWRQERCAARGGSVDRWE